MDILCTHCNYWVKCTPNEKAKVQEPYGFCMLESLFTYTAKTSCRLFNEGQPMSEQAWENSQRF